MIVYDCLWLFMIVYDCLWWFMIVYVFPQRNPILMFFFKDFADVVFGLLGHRSEQQEETSNDLSSTSRWSNLQFFGLLSQLPSGK